MRLIPLAEWPQHHSYPTGHGWHNRLRPENERRELLEAGVVVKDGGRWLINEAAWFAYVTAKAKEQAAA